MEVFIAGAESAGRTADLIEMHMLPALGRIALALERERPSVAVEPKTAIEDLRKQLAAARTPMIRSGVIVCRDALTEHLRGEALHDLDNQVVRWLVNRVQARSRRDEGRRVRGCLTGGAWSKALVIRQRGRVCVPPFPA